MKTIIAVAVASLLGLCDKGGTTAYDDIRSWAYNNNDVVWSAPDELWNRLEHQAAALGYADATALLVSRGYTTEE